MVNAANRRPGKAVVNACLIVFVLLLSHTALAVEQAHPDSHLYGGIPLAQWRTRIVDFDARSPQAAKAVDPLMAILADGRVDDVTRRNAAIALGNIREPARRVTPQLVEMTWRSGDQALWAAKALSLMGPAARDTTEHLRSIAQDEEQPLMMRQLALEALG